MAGDEHEGAWLGPDTLVVDAGEKDDVGAALVVALAEIRCPALAQVELVRPLLELLVQLPERGFVLGGSLGGVHARSLPGTRLSKTTERVTIAGVHEDQRRRARNEALFREVNERIVELDTGLGGHDRGGSPLIGFVCECPREDCSELLEVTHGQYEGVRENPRRFLVLPGHEDLDIAKVIDRNGQFLVVEKTGEAGEFAVEQDPRS